MWRKGCAAVLILPLVAPVARAQTPYGASGAAQLPPSLPSVEPPKPKPPKLEHIRKRRAEGLLGQPVLDTKGNAIGNIVDVLIDRQGHPNAAVIEFAGFFGVGNRKIAVAWTSLHFSVVKQNITITVDLDAAKLKSLPEYKPSAPSVPVATQPHAKS